MRVVHCASPWCSRGPIKAIARRVAAGRRPATLAWARSSRIRVHRIEPSVSGRSGSDAHGPDTRRSSRSPGTSSTAGDGRRSCRGVRGVSRELPRADRRDSVAQEDCASAGRDAADVRGAARRDAPRAACAPARSTQEAARKFFEENFKPVRISKLDDANGFLTGYYEPIIEGSRFPTERLPRVPIYRRPPDPLVHMGRPARKPAIGGFPNSGQSLRRDRRAASSCPTTTAPQIEDGALDGQQRLEICWI